MLTIYNFIYKYYWILRYMIIRSISLDKELNEKVQDYCKITGRTVSGLIVFLLKEHLEEQDGRIA